MKKPFIFFDFDGVISDSFKTAYSVQKMICPGITEDMYRKRFEGNINDWHNPENLHTKECRHDIDFFAEYVPRMKREVALVPGIKNVILELEKQYTLLIISSTISSPIQEFLTSHDLAQYFDWIMGNDVHKSKVEKMKMAFDRYKIGANGCVLITDTLGDLREAAHVNVGTIAVTWGFHTPETLNLGKPFCLVARPQELIDAVPRYFLTV